MDTVLYCRSLGRVTLPPKGAPTVPAIGQTRDGPPPPGTQTVGRGKLL